jgi:hypothetical protein
MRKHLLLTLMLLCFSTMSANTLAEASAWGKTKSGIKQSWGGVKQGSKEVWGGVKEGSKGAAKEVKKGSKGVWQSIKDIFK